MNWKQKKVWIPLGLASLAIFVVGIVLLLRAKAKKKKSAASTARQVRFKTDNDNLDMTVFNAEDGDFAQTPKFLSKALHHVKGLKYLVAKPDQETSPVGVVLDLSLFRTNPQSKTDLTKVLHLAGFHPTFDRLIDSNDEKAFHAAVKAGIRCFVLWGKAEDIKKTLPLFDLYSHIWGIIPHSSCVLFNSSSAQNLLHLLPLDEHWAQFGLLSYLDEHQLINQLVVGYDSESEASQALAMQVQNLTQSAEIKSVVQTITQGDYKPLESYLLSNAAALQSSPENIVGLLLLIEPEQIPSAVAFWSEFARKLRADPKLKKFAFRLLLGPNGTSYKCSTPEEKQAAGAVSATSITYFFGDPTKRTKAICKQLQTNSFDWFKLNVLDAVSFGRQLSASWSLKIACFNGGLVNKYDFESQQAGGQRFNRLRTFCAYDLASEKAEKLFDVVAKQSNTKNKAEQ